MREKGTASWKGTRERSYLPARGSVGITKGCWLASCTFTASCSLSGNSKQPGLWPCASWFWKTSISAFPIGRAHPTWAKPPEKSPKGLSVPPRPPHLPHGGSLPHECAQPEDNRLETAQASGHLHLDPFLPFNSTCDYPHPGWAPEREADSRRGCPQGQGRPTEDRSWAGTTRPSSPLPWAPPQQISEEPQSSYDSREGYNSEASFHSCCDSDEIDEDEDKSLCSQASSEISSETTYSDTTDEEESGSLNPEAMQEHGAKSKSQVAHPVDKLKTRQPLSRLLGHLKTGSSANLPATLSHKLPVKRGLHLTPVFSHSFLMPPAMSLAQRMVWAAFLRQSLPLAPTWGRRPPSASLATISRPFKRNCRSSLQRARCPPSRWS